MHFHRDVLAMCDLFPRHVLKPSSSDIFCGTPPLAFTFGLGGLLCFPLRVGASTVLIEKLTPETLLQTVERFHATIMFTAPTFYRQMAPLVARHDLSSLKKTVSAGEALPDSTRRLWRDATGIEMIDGIGGTELIHIFISAQGEAIVRMRLAARCRATSCRPSTTRCNRCRPARSASLRCAGRPVAVISPMRVKRNSCATAGICRAIRSTSTQTATCFIRRAPTT